MEKSEIIDTARSQAIEILLCAFNEMVESEMISPVTSPSYHVGMWYGKTGEEIICRAIAYVLARDKVSFFDHLGDPDVPIQKGTA